VIQVDSRRHVALAALIMLATLLQPVTVLQAAEPASVLIAAAVQPSLRIGGVPARERTELEIFQDAAVETAVTSEVDWRDRLPFRPTMSEKAYQQAKALAETAPVIEAPLPVPEALQESLAAPVLKAINFEGVTQTRACGTCRPPDTHGAVGLSQFVEITNSHLDVYQKALPNTRVKSVSLAAFFGYTAQFLFDPRVIFDASANRWIITAEAFPESPTVQRFFIAVSKTGSAIGSYFIYSLDVGTAMGSAAGDFFDFPQVGMDSKSIIITANIFGDDNSFKGARLLSIAKALLYNGLTLDFKVFDGLEGTLAPPIVLDGKAKTFLVCAPPSGSAITVYTLVNSNVPASASISASVINVPAYTLPPNAGQPGTANLIDSSDSRFINAGTQVGNSLFQVHTINVGGRPMPRFYEFNTARNTVIQQGTFAASPTSHDWNASIVANAARDVFVTWSSSDPANNLNAQVRFSGRRATDPRGVIGAGGALATSASFYNPSADTVERWGDYSAVTVDPSNSLRAWIVNEKIRTTTTWGSRIGRIGF
jgi:hypothetical protein